MFNQKHFNEMSSSLPVKYTSATMIVTLASGETIRVREFTPMESVICFVVYPQRKLMPKSMKKKKGSIRFSFATIP